MQVQPYLNFDGRCEEAIEFYKKAVGAKVEMMMRFKDSPEPPPPGQQHSADVANKIMHATIKIGDSTLGASDGRCTSQSKFSGVNLSLLASTEAEAEKCFKALSEGGQVSMPLTKTFFSPKFGMLTDKFGLMWMVLVQH
jgi:PhnB protein